VSLPQLGETEHSVLKHIERKLQVAVAPVLAM